MNVTITCDSENTQKIIQHLLSVGVLHATEPIDLKFFNIDYNVNDTQLNIMFKPNGSTKKKSDSNLYIYGARDTKTGKLVSDLTNPRRKYWDREVNAKSAIDSYNRSHKRYNTGIHEHVDLVKFELVEVPVDEQ